MKRMIPLITLLTALTGGMAVGNNTAPTPALTVSGFALEGSIEGENITFELRLKVDDMPRRAEIPLVIGDVAFLDGTFPSGSKLIRRNDAYVLQLGWRRSGDVAFRFASRPVKQDEWRQTRFSVPSAAIRKLSVLCDRDDLDVRFPGALDVQTDKATDGRTRVTGYLGISDAFEVGWKPEIRRLDSELVAACDANTIATASVGTLRLDTVFSYRIIQGSLNVLSLDLPAVNVIQVRGDDIKEWRIDRTEEGQPRLIVTLSRPKEGVYRLHVESEMFLPQFPCSFVLPVLAPRGVLRTSGFLMIGTDSAIKLTVNRAAGMTQVDQAAFPETGLDGDKTVVRAKPGRSRFAYQYANSPYTLELKADDIVSTFTADNRLTLSLAENELTFTASVEIDVRDAPAREITIETDPDPAWTVTSIAGQHVSEPDADVRDEAGEGESGGRRVIYVPFQQAVTGSALVTIQMERSLAPDAATFVAPRFRVLDAKSERGYLVASAEQGVRLKLLEVDGMREVHTGSAPMKVPGAQQAFRFKQPDWALTMGIERTPASLHSEVFHLVSLGEGVLYASASITYHISGAPVQMFRIKVPSNLQNVEFTGADIEGWTREGEIHTVRLQTRIMGDFTLLVTYDYQFPYAGADIPLGVVETVGTESEVGYIALASSLSLKREHREIAPSIIVIDKDEIPSAYTAPVTDPILESFKYVRVPHTAVLSVTPYETEQLLGQIADYTRLSTRFTKDGEAVTTATYYVKNSSRQYLVLRLPEGVKLWSVKLVDENGIRSDVLSQTSDEGLLIPILRPRDPNAALHVEVTFAQSHAGMNALKSALFGVDCKAPVLPASQATYASWEIVAPDGFAVAGSGGSMTPASGTGYVGFGRVARLTLNLGTALLDGPGGRRVRQVLSTDFAPQRRAEFVRTVNLSGGEPLALTVFLAPDWLGGARAPRMFGAVCGAGLILLVLGLAARRLRWVRALGITVLAFGMAQFGLGRAVLAVIAILLAAATMLWLLLALLPWLWRLLRLLGRGIASLWRFVRNTRARVYQRKLELRLAATGAVDQDAPTAQPPQPDSEARTPPVLLCLIAAAGALLLGTTWCSAGEPPVMDEVTITVAGPGNERDAEPSAEVSMILSFEAKERTSFVLVPASCVLLSSDLSSHDLEIVPEGTGYVLRVTERGDYRVVVTYRTPVSEVGGAWRMQLAIPPSIRNTVSLHLPQPGIDVQCAEAVLLRSQDDAQGTVAEAVLGPARQALFTWQPRVRKTALEDAVFFCEVNSLAVLQSGVVDLTTVVRYQIAQGEIKELKLRVPDGMSVTSVRAPGLATWSFDPADRLLEAVLEKPVSGDFALTLVMQIASEGLPYKATLRTPDVLDAVRQRGSIAVAADDDVQVRIAESSGVNPMNIEDFPAALTAAQQAERQKRGRSLTVRRSFRYGQAGGAAISVEAEKVLPEIRVAETGTLSIADERIVLATKLVLTVAKSGIFSAVLRIPNDYDVETLTGRDVSHWDETGVEDEGKGVIVHFTRQIVDSTDINLVVARTEKGIEESIVVPRVEIADASKHSGRLTVSGERGVRLMVDTHRGVDVRKASEEGIRQAGVLVFDILRPAWEIVLKTDVLAPVVKPEVLQWVDLAEGMLQCRVYLQYRIENAGVKSFRIQSPAPGASLAFTGRQIARVAEVDKAAGIWQVDLHGKVEDRFSMTATYQVPYDPASREVRILPLQAMDAEEQRGYLVVTCAGRVQVQAAGNLTGLKVEDPRTVPSTFGAGDLSGAILCYRTLRSDYDLSLSVVRHDSASVLPASIDRAQFTSVLSTSGDLLTRAELDLRVGNLRLLRVTLPSPDDTLWTVLVDGREVAMSRDGAAYCVPLEETQGKETSQVDLVYAGHAAISGIPSRWHFTAPKFGLPLTGITWRFYAPAGWRYYQFGGSMVHGEEDGGILQVFDAGRYMAYNMEQRSESIQNAREVLDAGEELIKAGQQKRARKAFQVALNYSQGQEDLNEDARVQLRNVMKQQVKMGLVNRRDALRFSRNIIDEQQIGQMEGFQDGDFTQEYAEGVAQRLSDRDNDALEIVANRIIDQQAAAAGVVTAIRVTMPTQGRSLPFRRALQIDPNVDLTVSFVVSRGHVAGLVEVLWPAAALFLALWLIPMQRRRRAVRQADGERRTA